MFRIFRKIIFWLFFLFILPAIGSLVWWANVDRPAAWHAADWSSSGLLPTADREPDAVIHLVVARTGGLKGALALHSWIVTKKAGRQPYQRYDKVGWGRPVRLNAYAADAKWYSNAPEIIKTIRGKEAEALIPKIETAIANYPHANRGGYSLWPGPNSNSFISHVLREVPEIGATLPPNAVGKDYLAGGKIFHASSDRLNYEVSFRGIAGLSIGNRSGIEIHFLGLVTGLDFKNPALKLPGFGRLAFSDLTSDLAFAR